MYYFARIQGNYIQYRMRQEKIKEEKRARDLFKKQKQKEREAKLEEDRK